jgi:hypothetical protein
MNHSKHTYISLIPSVYVVYISNYLNVTAFPLKRISSRDSEAE